MFAVKSQPEAQNVHASCVAVGSRGILILGHSGEGKSDLALRLIDRGAILVADDRCDVWVDRDKIWCRPPATLAGKMEVRGIGIVDMPWIEPVPIALAVRLTERYERMPDERRVEMVAGHALPSILLAPFEGTAAMKVVMALERLGATT